MALPSELRALDRHLRSFNDERIERLRAPEPALPVPDAPVATRPPLPRLVQSMRHGRFRVSIRTKGMRNGDRVAFGHDDPRMLVRLLVQQFGVMPVDAIASVVVWEN